MTTEFWVYNATDGIHASPEPFTSREDAEAFCVDFRGRFAGQGFYRTSGGDRIAPEEIDLRIEGEIA